MLRTALSVAIVGFHRHLLFPRPLVYLGLLPAATRSYSVNHSGLWTESDNRRVERKNTTLSQRTYVGIKSLFRAGVVLVLSVGTWTFMGARRGWLGKSAPDELADVEPIQSCLVESTLQSGLAITTNPGLPYDDEHGLVSLNPTTTGDSFMDPVSFQPAFWYIPLQPGRRPNAAWRAFIFMLDSHVRAVRRLWKRRVGSTTTVSICFGYCLMCYIVQLL